MSLTIARRVRVPAFVAALVLPLLVLVPASSQAADPIPTTTRVFLSNGVGARTLGLDARVRSASGVPTGTITFYRVGDPVPFEEPKTVDAGGHVKIIVGTDPCGTAGCTAVFTATGAYANSQGNINDGLPLKVVPQPTILGLGGPSLLTVPLTTSVRTYYSDGTPAEGALVQYSSGGAMTDPKSTFICYAQSDLNGLSTCNGAGGSAAVMSLLGTGTFANVYPINNKPPVQVFKLPIIAVLK